MVKWYRKWKERKAAQRAARVAEYAALYRAMNETSRSLHVAGLMMHVRITTFRNDAIAEMLEAAAMVEKNGGEGGR